MPMTLTITGGSYADLLDEIAGLSKQLSPQQITVAASFPPITVAELRDIIGSAPQASEKVLLVQPELAADIAAATELSISDPAIVVGLAEAVATLPKKRGRKSNAEKAAEAAAAQQEAQKDPTPTLQNGPAEVTAVLASAPAEDPMPKELPGETFFDIPDFLQREQPKKEAAPVETKPVTIEDARKCMAELLEKKSMAAVQEALAKFGANRISALPAGTYNEFCAHVSSLLGAK